MAEGFACGGLVYGAIFHPHVSVLCSGQSLALAEAACVPCVPGFCAGVAGATLPGLVRDSLGHKPSRDDFLFCLSSGMGGLSAVECEEVDLAGTGTCLLCCAGCGAGYGKGPVIGLTL